MEEECFGYYLYARPPWAQADIPLEWLQDEINLEAEGKYGVHSRALPGSNKNRDTSRVQTFQIYMPLEQRRRLNQIYQEPVAKEELTDEAYMREVFHN